MGWLGWVGITTANEIVAWQELECIHPCSSCIPIPVMQLLYVHTLYMKMYSHVSCMTRIGMHELHGWMHPSSCHATILLPVAVPTNPSHPMTSSTTSTLRYEPVETLVAKQQPTNVLSCLGSLVVKHSPGECSVMGSNPTWGSFFLEKNISGVVVSLALPCL